MNYREKQYQEIIEAVADALEGLSLPKTAAEIRQMVKEVEVLPDDFAPDLTFNSIKVAEVRPGDRVFFDRAKTFFPLILTVHATDTSDDGEIIIRFGSDRVERFFPEDYLGVCRGN